MATNVGSISFKVEIDSTKFNQQMAALESRYNNAAWGSSSNTSSSVNNSQSSSEVLGKQTQTQEEINKTLEERAKIQQSLNNSTTVGNTVQSSQYDVISAKLNTISNKLDKIHSTLAIAPTVNMAQLVALDNMLLEKRTDLRKTIDYFEQNPIVAKTRHEQTESFTTGSSRSSGQSTTQTNTILFDIRELIRIQNQTSSNQSTSFLKEFRNLAAAANEGTMATKRLEELGKPGIGNSVANITAGAIASVITAPITGATREITSQVHLYMRDITQGILQSVGLLHPDEAIQKRKREESREEFNRPPIVNTILKAFKTQVDEVVTAPIKTTGKIISGTVQEHTTDFAKGFLNEFGVLHPRQQKGQNFDTGFASLGKDIANTIKEKIKGTPFEGVVKAIEEFFKKPFNQASPTIQQPSKKYHPTDYAFALESHAQEARNAARKGNYRDFLPSGSIPDDYETLPAEEQARALKRVEQQYVKRHKTQYRSAYKQGDFENASILGERDLSQGAALDEMYRQVIAKKKDWTPKQINQLQGYRQYFGSVHTEILEGFPHSPGNAFNRIGYLPEGLPASEANKRKQIPDSEQVRGIFRRAAEQRWSDTPYGEKLKQELLPYVDQETTPLQSNLTEETLSEQNQLKKGRRSKTGVNAVAVDTDLKPLQDLNALLDEKEKRVKRIKKEWEANPLVVYAFVSEDYLKEIEKERKKAGRPLATDIGIPVAPSGKAGTAIEAPNAHKPNPPTTPLSSTTFNKDQYLEDIGKKLDIIIELLRPKESFLGSLLAAPFELIKHTLSSFYTGGVEHLGAHAAANLITTAINLGTPPPVNHPEQAPSVNPEQAPSVNPEQASSTTKYSFLNTFSNLEHLQELVTSWTAFLNTLQTIPTAPDNQAQWDEILTTATSWNIFLAHLIAIQQAPEIPDPWDDVTLTANSWVAFINALSNIPKPPQRPTRESDDFGWNEMESLFEEQSPSSTSRPRLFLQTPLQSPSNPVPLPPLDYSEHPDAQKNQDNILEEQANNLEILKAKQLENLEKQLKLTQELANAAKQINDNPVVINVQTNQITEAQEAVKTLEVVVQKLAEEVKKVASTADATRLKETMNAFKKAVDGGNRAVAVDLYPSAVTQVEEMRKQSEEVYKARQEAHEQGIGEKPYKSKSYEGLTSLSYITNYTNQLNRFKEQLKNTEQLVEQPLKPKADLEQLKALDDMLLEKRVDYKKTEDLFKEDPLEVQTKTDKLDNLSFQIQEIIPAPDVLQPLKESEFHIPTIDVAPVGTLKPRPALPSATKLQDYLDPKFAQIDIDGKSGKVQGFSTYEDMLKESIPEYSKIVELLSKLTDIPESKLTPGIKKVIKGLQSAYRDIEKWLVETPAKYPVLGPIIKVGTAAILFTLATELGEVTLDPLVKALSEFAIHHGLDVGKAIGELVYNVVKLAPLEAVGHIFGTLLEHKYGDIAPSAGEIKGLVEHSIGKESLDAAGQALEAGRESLTSLLADTFKAMAESSNPAVQAIGKGVTTMSEYLGVSIEAILEHVLGFAITTKGADDVGKVLVGKGQRDFLQLDAAFAKNAKNVEKAYKTVQELSKKALKNFENGLIESAISQLTQADILYNETTKVLKDGVIKNQGALTPKAYQELFPTPAKFEGLDNNPLKVEEIEKQTKGSNTFPTVGQALFAHRDAFFKLSNAKSNILGNKENQQSFEEKKQQQESLLKLPTEVLQQAPTDEQREGANAQRLEKIAKTKISELLGATKGSKGVENLTLVDVLGKVIRKDADNTNFPRWLESLDKVLHDPASHIKLGTIQEIKEGLDATKKIIQKAKELEIELPTFAFSTYGKVNLEGLVAILEKNTKLKKEFDNLEQQKKAGIFPPEDLKGVGAEGIKGLEIGITERIATLNEVLEALSQGMIDRVCEILKISSPSQVFIEIGNNIVEGLILGIQEFLPKITTIFDHLPETFKSSLQSSITGIETTLKEGKDYLNNLFKEPAAQQTEQNTPLIKEPALTNPLLRAVIEPTTHAIAQGAEGQQLFPLQPGAKYNTDKAIEAFKNEELPRIGQQANEALKDKNLVEQVQLIGHAVEQVQMALDSTPNIDIIPIEKIGTFFETAAEVVQTIVKTGNVEEGTKTLQKEAESLALETLSNVSAKGSMIVGSMVKANREAMLRNVSVPKILENLKQNPPIPQKEDQGIHLIVGVSGGIDKEVLQAALGPNGTGNISNRLKKLIEPFMKEGQKYIGVKRTADLQDNALKGYSEDAIEATTQIVKHLEAHPDNTVALVGESFGGYEVKEIYALLKLLGHSNKITGAVAAGTPKLDTDLNVPEVKNMMNVNDHLRTELLGEGIENNGLNEEKIQSTVKQGILHHLIQDPDLKKENNLATTHELPAYIADNDFLKPLGLKSLEEFYTEIEHLLEKARIGIETKQDKSLFDDITKANSFEEVVTSYKKAETLLFSIGREKQSFLKIVKSLANNVANKGFGDQMAAFVRNYFKTLEQYRQPLLEVQKIANELVGTTNVSQLLDQLLTSSNQFIDPVVIQASGKQDAIAFLDTIKDNMQNLEKMRKLARAKIKEIVGKLDEEQNKADLELRQQLATELIRYIQMADMTSYALVMHPDQKNEKQEVYAKQFGEFQHFELKAFDELENINTARAVQIAKNQGIGLQPKTNANLAATEIPVFEPERNNNSSLQAVKPLEEPEKSLQAVKPLEEPEKSLQAVKPLEEPEKSLQAVKPLEEPEKSLQAVKPLEEPEKSLQAVKPLEEPEKRLQAVKPLEEPEKSLQSQEVLAPGIPVLEQEGNAAIPKDDSVEPKKVKQGFQNPVLRSVIDAGTSAFEAGRKNSGVGLVLEIPNIPKLVQTFDWESAQENLQSANVGQHFEGKNIIEQAKLVVDTISSVQEVFNEMPSIEINKIIPEEQTKNLFNALQESAQTVQEELVKSTDVNTVIKDVTTVINNSVAKLSEANITIDNAGKVAEEVINNVTKSIQQTDSLKTAKQVIDNEIKQQGPKIMPLVGAVVDHIQFNATKQIAMAGGHLIKENRQAMMEQVAAPKVLQEVERLKSANVKTPPSEPKHLIVGIAGGTKEETIQEFLGPNKTGNISNRMGTILKPFMKEGQEFLGIPRTSGIDRNFSRGYSEDAVAATAKIINHLEAHPENTVSLLGESAGGFDVREVYALLEHLGYEQRVKGALAVGTPSLDSDIDIDASKVKNIMNTNDALRTSLIKDKQGRVIPSQAGFFHHTVEDENLNKKANLTPEHLAIAYVTDPDVIEGLQLKTTQEFLQEKSQDAKEVVKTNAPTKEQGTKLKQMLQKGLSLKDLFRIYQEAIDLSHKVEDSKDDFILELEKPLNNVRDENFTTQINELIDQLTNELGEQTSVLLEVKQEVNKLVGQKFPTFVKNILSKNNAGVNTELLFSSIDKKTNKIINPLGDDLDKIKSLQKKAQVEINNIVKNLDKAKSAQDLELQQVLTQQLLEQIDLASKLGNIIIDNPETLPFVRDAFINRQQKNSKIQKQTWRDIDKINLSLALDLANKEDFTLSSNDEQPQKPLNQKPAKLLLPPTFKEMQKALTGRVIPELKELGIENLKPQKLLNSFEGLIKEGKTIEQAIEQIKADIIAKADFSQIGKHITKSLVDGQTKEMEANKGTFEEAVKTLEKPEQSLQAVKTLEKPEQSLQAVKALEEPEQSLQAVKALEKPEQSLQAVKTLEKPEQSLQAVKALEEPLEEHTNASKQIGKDVAESFVQGEADEMNNLKPKIAETAEIPEEVTRDVTKIHSHSPIFIKIGEDIVGSIVEGMNKTTLEIGKTLDMIRQGSVEQIPIIKATKNAFTNTEFRKNQIETIATTQALQSSNNLPKNEQFPLKSEDKELLILMGGLGRTLQSLKLQQYPEALSLARKEGQHIVLKENPTVSGKAFEDKKLEGLDWLHEFVTGKGILGQINKQGFSDDSVAVATRIIHALLNHPQLESVKVAGESMSTVVAEEIIAILNHAFDVVLKRPDLKEKVSGFGLGLPDFENSIISPNMTKFLSSNEAFIGNAGMGIGKQFPDLMKQLGVQVPIENKPTQNLTDLIEHPAGNYLNLPIVRNAIGLKSVEEVGKIFPEETSPKVLATKGTPEGGALGLVSSVLQFQKGLLKTINFQKVGQDVTKSLVAGQTEEMEASKSKLEKNAEIPEEITRDITKIHSQSPIFFGIGADIMKSIYVGITETAASLGKEGVFAGLGSLGLDADSIKKPFTNKQFRQNQIERVAAPEALKAGEKLPDSEKLQLESGTKELLILMNGLARPLALFTERFPESFNQAMNPGQQILFHENPTISGKAFEDKNLELIDWLREFWTGKGALGQVQTQGFSEDSVNLAAKIFDALKHNPDLQVKVVGESVSTVVAEEVVAILNQIAQILNQPGLRERVSGIGLGVPDFANSLIAENMTKFFSPNESLLGKEGLGSGNLLKIGLAQVGVEAQTANKPTQNLPYSNEHVVGGYLNLPDVRNAMGLKSVEETGAVFPVETDLDTLLNAKPEEGTLLGNLTKAIQARPKTIDFLSKLFRQEEEKKENPVNPSKAQANFDEGLNNIIEPFAKSTTLSPKSPLSISMEDELNWDESEKLFEEPEFNWDESVDKTLEEKIPLNSGRLAHKALEEPRLKRFNWDESFEEPEFNWDESADKVLEERIPLNWDESVDKTLEEEIPFNWGRLAKKALKKEIPISPTTKGYDNKTERKIDDLEEEIPLSPTTKKYDNKTERKLDNLQENVSEVGNQTKKALIDNLDANLKNVLKVFAEKVFNIKIEEGDLSDKILDILDNDLSVLLGAHIEAMVEQATEQTKNVLKSQLGRKFSVDSIHANEEVERLIEEFSTLLTPKFKALNFKDLQKLEESIAQIFIEIDKAIQEKTQEGSTQRKILEAISAHYKEQIAESAQGIVDTTQQIQDVYHGDFMQSIIGHVQGINKHLNDKESVVVSPTSHLDKTVATITDASLTPYEKYVKLIHQLAETIPLVGEAVRNLDEKLYELTGVEGIIQKIQAGYEAFHLGLFAFEQISQQIEFSIQNIFFGLGDWVKSLYEATAEAEKFREALKFGDIGIAVNGKTELELFTKQADRLGTSYKEAVKGAQALHAAQIGTSQEGTAPQRALQLQEGFAGRGIFDKEQEAAFTALASIAQQTTVSLSSVTGELENAIPGALNVAAQGFNTTRAQMIRMLETGQVLSTDFLPKFAQALKANNNKDIQDNLPAKVSRNLQGFTNNAQSNPVIFGTYIAWLNIINGVLELINRNWTIFGLILGGVALHALEKIYHTILGIIEVSETGGVFNNLFGEVLKFPGWGITGKVVKPVLDLATSPLEALPLLASKEGRQSIIPAYQKNPIIKGAGENLQNLWDFGQKKVDFSLITDGLRNIGGSFKNIKTLASEAMGGFVSGMERAYVTSTTLVANLAGGIKNIALLLTGLAESIAAMLFELLPIIAVLGAIQYGMALWNATSASVKESSEKLKDIWDNIKIPDFEIKITPKLKPLDPVEAVDQELNAKYKFDSDSSKDNFFGGRNILQWVTGGADAIWHAPFNILENRTTSENLRTGDEDLDRFNNQVSPDLDKVFNNDNTQKYANELSETQTKLDVISAKRSQINRGSITPEQDAKLQDEQKGLQARKEKLSEKYFGGSDQTLDAQIEAFKGQQKQTQTEIAHRKQKIEDREKDAASTNPLWRPVGEGDRAKGNQEDKQVIEDEARLYNNLGEAINKLKEHQNQLHDVTARGSSDFQQLIKVLDSLNYQLGQLQYKFERLKAANQILIDAAKNAANLQAYSSASSLGVANINKSALQEKDLNLQYQASQQQATETESLRQSVAKDVINEVGKNIDSLKVYFAPRGTNLQTFDLQKALLNNQLSPAAITAASATIQRDKKQGGDVPGSSEKLFELLTKFAELSTAAESSKVEASSKKVALTDFGVSNRIAQNAAIESGRDLVKAYEELKISIQNENRQWQRTLIEVQLSYKQKIRGITESYQDFVRQLELKLKQASVELQQAKNLLATVKFKNELEAGFTPGVEGFTRKFQAVLEQAEEKLNVSGFNRGGGKQRELEEKAIANYEEIYNLSRQFRSIQESYRQFAYERLKQQQDLEVQQVRLYRDRTEAERAFYLQAVKLKDQLASVGLSFADLPKGIKEHGEALVNAVRDVALKLSGINIDRPAAPGSVIKAPTNQPNQGIPLRPGDISSSQKPINSARITSVEQLKANASHSNPHTVKLVNTAHPGVTGIAKPFKIEFSPEIHKANQVLTKKTIPIVSEIQKPAIYGGRDRSNILGDLGSWNPFKNTEGLKGELRKANDSYIERLLYNKQKLQEQLSHKFKDSTLPERIKFDQSYINKLKNFPEDPLPSTFNINDLHKSWEREKAAKLKPQASLPSGLLAASTNLTGLGGTQEQQDKILNKGKIVVQKTTKEGIDPYLKAFEEMIGFAETRDYADPYKAGPDFMGTQYKLNLSKFPTNFKKTWNYGRYQNDDEDAERYGWKKRYKDLSPENQNRMTAEILADEKRFPGGKEAIVKAFTTKKLADLQKVFDIYNKFWVSLPGGSQNKGNLEATLSNLQKIGLKAFESEQNIIASGNAAESTQINSPLPQTPIAKQRPDVETYGLNSLDKSILPAIPAIPASKSESVVTDPSKIVKDNTIPFSPNLADGNKDKIVLPDLPQLTQSQIDEPIKKLNELTNIIKEKTQVQKETSLAEGEANIRGINESIATFRRQSRLDLQNSEFGVREAQISAPKTLQQYTGVTTDAQKLINANAEARLGAQHQTFTNSEAVRTAQENINNATGVLDGLEKLRTQQLEAIENQAEIKSKGAKPEEKDKIEAQKAELIETTNKQFDLQKAIAEDVIRKTSAQIPVLKQIAIEFQNNQEAALAYGEAIREAEQDVQHLLFKENSLATLFESRANDPTQFNTFVVNADKRQAELLKNDAEYKQAQLTLEKQIIEQGVDDKSANQLRGAVKEIYNRKAGDITAQTDTVHQAIADPLNNFFDGLLSLDSLRGGRSFHVNLIKITQDLVQGIAKNFTTPLIKSATENLSRFISGTNGAPQAQGLPNEILNKLSAKPPEITQATPYVPASYAFKELGGTGESWGNSAQVKVEDLINPTASNNIVPLTLDKQLNKEDLSQVDYQKFVNGDTSSTLSFLSKPTPSQSIGDLLGKSPEGNSSMELLFNAPPSGSVLDLLTQTNGNGQQNNGEHQTTGGLETDANGVPKPTLSNLQTIAKDPIGTLKNFATGNLTKELNQLTTPQQATSNPIGSLLNPGFNFNGLGAGAIDTATAGLTSTAETSALDSLFPDLLAGLFAEGGEIPHFATGGEVPDKIANFFEGGAITSTNVPNFATGGLIGGIQQAMQKEGPNAQVIVASSGEHILSNRNGDAQTFRQLQANGQWQSIKQNTNQPVAHFNNGGQVGGIDINSGTSPINSNNSKNNSQPTFSTTNHQTIINVQTPDADSFRKSNYQIQQQAAQNQKNASKYKGNNG